MFVFSGSSNKPLAQLVARELECNAGEVEISKFANDETRVFVKEKKLNTYAVILQSLSAPVDTHIVEYSLLADALHRMGAQELIAVMPWLGYSKQDKVFRPGEPLSVKVIAKILQVVPIKRLITFDLHNLAILGFFDVPVTNLSARPLFSEYFQKQITEKSIVVAPDAGAIKTSTAFSMELGIPVAYIDKKRDLQTGDVTINGISRKAKGFDVIIIDDMIVTGSTLIESAKYLKEKEKVKSITVAATHHLYVPGAQEAMEKSPIDRIYVTDTIKQQIFSPKLTILSVAPLISEAIKQTTE